MFENNGFSDGYIIGRDTGNNNNNGMFGEGNGWWFLLILLFAFGGWGNNGWGNRNNGGGCGSGEGSGNVYSNYVLASDFSSLERKIDGVNNGLCDGFYAVNTSFGNLNNTLANNFASVQNTMTQGFAGLNTVNVQQGYENRMATQAVGSQLAQCCCDIREGIQASTTQGILNTNTLQSQLAQCCCDNRAAIADTNYNIATQANGITRQIADVHNATDRAVERGFCDTNYNMSTQANALTRQISDVHNATDRSIERGFCDLNYNLASANSNTLQAIDRVGDRIIDHLNAEKTERLRDENQALRLAASQQAQNNYLISQLGPKCPQPAYVVQPPQSVTFPTNCCGTVNYSSGCSGCGSI